MKNWYSRPVFFVKDAEASIEFYKQLGFTLVGFGSLRLRGKFSRCYSSRPSLPLAGNKTESGVTSLLEVSGVGSRATFCRLSTADSRLHTIFYSFFFT